MCCPWSVDYTKQRRLHDVRLNAQFTDALVSVNLNEKLVFSTRADKKVHHAESLLRDERKRR